MDNIRLYKSTTDKKLAGVCGGLAEVIGIDPSIVRILWALLAVFSGIGIILYIIAAIILPEGKPQNHKNNSNTSNYNRNDYNNSRKTSYTTEPKEEEAPETKAYDVSYKEVKSFDDVDQ